MKNKLIITTCLIFVLACETLNSPQADEPPISVPETQTNEAVQIFQTEEISTTRIPGITETETHGSLRSTLTPTITPSPSITPTSTKIFATSPQPMEIEVMRQGEYPGSDIFVDSELERGSNYSQYYVHYLSEDLKIYALLTIPDAKPPAGGFPAIIFNHGYIPPDQYRTTQDYESYVDELAKAGYIVFRIDYRGHDQSEGQPESAYGYPGYTIDVLNSINTIKRHALVNPEKIGMWGHSMGGFLTLRAMVISNDIKAGVIWAGVVAPYPGLLYNWPQYNSIPHQLDNGVDWRETFTSEYGTPEQNPSLWANFSANSYLKDLSGPLQLHHGTADDVVPVGFSVQLVKDVIKAGGVANLYTYEGDDHNISNSFSETMSRTIDFFDQYLKQ